MYKQPEQSVLKVLAYFDVFNYPLLKEEIFSFLDVPMHPDALSLILQRLTVSERIFKLGDFYSLQNDAALRERRIDGNNRAIALLNTAYRIGAFLYQFPYVRGIGISGSLSKNFADDSSDIDFFIITRRNRLWIARTIMHLFKKLTFLTRHQHWFCMNYYIDEEALHIEEHNIFTATELVTLLPVCGDDTMQPFFAVNGWTNHYFPNQPAIKHVHHKATPNRGKKLMEWLCNNALGSRLDDFLMRLTTRRWQQKEQQQRVNANGHRMGLKNGKHFSKPNPGYLQKKVLDSFEQKLQQVDQPAFRMAKIV